MFANSGEPDQTPPFDLVLHCLLMSHKKDAKFIWVNSFYDNVKDLSSPEHDVLKYLFNVWCLSQVVQHHQFVNHLSTRLKDIYCDPLMFLVRPSDGCQQFALNNIS